MPPVLDLIQGVEKDLGYEEIRVHKEPGTKFGYSGGGFLVLQHLLESWEKKGIAEIVGISGEVGNSERNDLCS